VADGLFNLCGRRTAELSKDGRTYRLEIRSLADYAKKEEAILARVGNPYAGIELIKDRNVQQMAMKIAADTIARPLIATMVDEDRFDRSMRGLSWSIWRAMGKNHSAEFPQDLPAEQGIQLGADFIDWFGDINAIVNAIHTIEEKTELGNSNGLTETAASGQ
jgi:hypothetical protein